MSTPHYVCTGDCRGVSDDPEATCQAEDCTHTGERLTACTCTDDSHQEAYAAERTH